MLPAVATNHQEQVDWPEHAQATRSVERHAALCSATNAGAFLEPPLYATAFARGFGTLYTAVYRPGSRTVTYRWPGHESWQQSLAPLRPARGPSDSRSGADRHVGAGPR